MVKRGFIIGINLIIMVMLLTGFTTKENTVSSISIRKVKDTKIFEDITYKVVKDKALKLDMYMPTVSKYEKTPTIFYVHGGFWAYGDKKGEIPYLIDLIDALREKGFLVVSVDYRLANKDVKFPSPLEDVKDAIKFLRKNAKEYNIDENKIGIWGSSAGGHLALMEGLTADSIYMGSDDLRRFSSKVNFIVSWYGPTDLSKVKGKNPSKVATNFIGYSIKQNKKAYINASPITYLKKESPPILLIHGKKDSIVPISQSKSFYDKGKKLEGNIQFISVENAGHGFVPMEGEISPSLDEIKEKTISFIEEGFKNE